MAIDGVQFRDLRANFSTILACLFGRIPTPDYVLGVSETRP